MDVLTCHAIHFQGEEKKKSPRGMIHVLMRPVRTAAQGEKADKKQPLHKKFIDCSPSDVRAAG